MVGESSLFGPFNAYGLGEAPQNEIGVVRVIADLIKKIFIHRKYPVEVLDDGNQVRVYIC